jgi:hypothetical protein
MLRQDVLLFGMNISHTSLLVLCERGGGCGRGNRVLGGGRSCAFRTQVSFHFLFLLRYLLLAGFVDGAGCDFLNEFVARRLQWVPERWHGPGLAITGSIAAMPPLAAPRDANRAAILQRSECGQPIRLGRDLAASTGFGMMLLRSLLLLVLLGVGRAKH